MMRGGEGYQSMDANERIPWQNFDMFDAGPLLTARIGRNLPESRLESAIPPRRVEWLLVITANSIVVERSKERTNKDWDGNKKSINQSKKKEERKKERKKEMARSAQGRNWKRGEMDISPNLMKCGQLVLQTRLPMANKRKEMEEKKLIESVTVIVATWAMTRRWRDGDATVMRRWWDADATVMRWWPRRITQGVFINEYLAPLHAPAHIINISDRC